MNKFSLFLLLLMLSSCSLKQVADIPFEEAKRRMAEVYQTKQKEEGELSELSEKPRDLTDLVTRIKLERTPEFREKLRKLSDVVAYVESDHELSMKLTDRFRKMPTYRTFVTLRPINDNQTEIEVLSQDLRKPYMSCCCFIYFDKYDRVRERDMMKSIKGRLNK